MYQDNPPPYSASPPPPGMAPPPPGIKPDYTSSQPYPQHEQQATVQATHVIITQGPSPILGPNPQRTICPSCHAEITTDVQIEPSTKTHLFALLLCLFQCYLCCCIPYCIDSCQSRNHYCPNCRAYLGSYEN